MGGAEREILALRVSHLMVLLKQFRERSRADLNRGHYLAGTTKIS